MIRKYSLLMKQSGKYDIPPLQEDRAKNRELLELRWTEIQSLVEKKLMPKGGKIPAKFSRFYIVNKDPLDNTKWRISLFGVNAQDDIIPLGHRVFKNLIGIEDSVAKYLRTDKLVDFDAWEKAL
ncbi:MAG: hypothetical protein WC511_02695 [Candidatus Pacearchaeota archaeon]